MKRETQYPVQMVVRMPAAMHNALKALAAENDRTVASEVRRLIRRHVEQENGRSSS